MKCDLPDLTFPFSSHTSSKICLQSALNIVTLVDNLPYPNPDHTIPLTLPPYLSTASRVEIPRAMPTFACCVMQASYAMLMLYLKARAKHANSPEDSGSAKGLSLTGFLNELQQNLRLVSKILANYAIAAEALQGMKGEFSFLFAILIADQVRGGIALGFFGGLIWIYGRVETGSNRECPLTCR
jgi:hypothetical protein